VLKTKRKRKEEGRSKEAKGERAEEKTKKKE